MADELRVGDTAKARFHKVRILAIYGDTAFVCDEQDSAWCDYLSTFTRIEPAAPEHKFRVGQDVRIIPDLTGPCPRTVTGIEIRYYMDGSPISFREDELEAVAPDCPHCNGTGKVADG